ncbi:FAM72 protein-domain-containing protein [Sporodiniella umbellata]|nr:FAM72 protein-domain-containing protein [Sporodiniella umbellata]
MESTVTRNSRQRRTTVQETAHQAYIVQQQSVTERSDLLSPVKPVYRLTCKHCHTIVCARSMKAILLADTRIELYSTDTPSQSMCVLDKDYLTRSCHCRIRDVACLKCGNVIGYHVVSPCVECLEACNNGHFWMFHSSVCDPTERRDGKKKVLWSTLPRAELDIEFLRGNKLPHDQLCR